MRVMIITHTQERTEHDERGNVIAEAGEVYVSHGIDLDTGRGIVMPWEKWSNFRHKCVNYEGEWYLK